jgi:hypothetical protein
VTSTEAKQWQRRALKAEAQIEMMESMRHKEAETELNRYRELAACRVALKEAQEAIEWALNQGGRS